MNIFDTDTLFCDVGSKLQKVAKWAYIICAVLVLIGGGIGVIAAMFSGSLLVFLLTLVGVALFVGLYLLAAVIGSWYIHGFGILVEKAEKDLDREPKEEPYQPIYGTGTTPYAAPQPTPVGGWKCSCGRVNPSYLTTCSCGVRKPQVMPNAEHKWLCDGCGNMRSASPCEYCGKL